MIPQLAALPIIDRVPTLPYFPTYEMWCDHLDRCAKCATVMVSGDQEVASLCWEGQGLQHAISGQLAAMADLAALN